MSSPGNTQADEPVLATFRFGPSFRIFASLWWLMGPVPLVLFSVSVLRGGDPVNLFVFLFLAAVPLPIWGLTLWRTGIDITEHFVVIRRLRKPLCFDRSSTMISIRNGGSAPIAHITDRLGTRRTYAVTALRTGGRKIRELAAYVPVTVIGKPVEPRTRA